jgi:hypothetical protein
MLNFRKRTSLNAGLDATSTDPQVTRSAHPTINQKLIDYGDQTGAITSNQNQSHSILRPLDRATAVLDESTSQEHKRRVIATDKRGKAAAIRIISAGVLEQHRDVDAEPEGGPQPVVGDAVVHRPAHLGPLAIKQVDPMHINAITREDSAFLILNHLRRWCRDRSSKKGMHLMDMHGSVHCVNKLILGFGVRRMRKMIAFWGPSGSLPQAGPDYLKMVIRLRQPTVTQLTQCKQPRRRQFELVMWNWNALVEDMLINVQRSNGPNSEFINVAAAVQPWNLILVERKQARILRSVPESMWPQVLGHEMFHSIQDRLNTLRRLCQRGM